MGSFSPRSLDIDVVLDLMIHDLDVVRALVGRIFPDQELAALPADHPLFRAVFTVGEVRDRQTGTARPVELEGIAVKDRLVLVYSKNDVVTQLKRVSNPYGNGYDGDSCRRVAVNIVAHALQN